jgi:peptidoglycan/xylan/chitin deacetylase (PgdA/CDA1 family)/sulfur carrier protein ThiS
VIVGVAIVVVAAISVVVAERLAGRRTSSTLTVIAAGRPVHVVAGTTLAEAAARFALHPRAGDLLDVTGRGLRRGVVPGHLLVDGRPVPAGSRLRSGDRIAVVDGQNRTEPLIRHVVQLSGGAPSDPQFTVTRVPGEQVVVRGALSHQLVSASFRPTGAAKVERAVALTFDDGPSPQFTPRILAALQKLRVHATFFVIGYLAQTYPDLVRRELRLGMTVGNHTYNHPEVPPFGQLPPRLIADEIALGSEILGRLGVHPRVFRPPGGSTSPAVVRAAATLGERVVLWSVDPTDWQPGTSKGQIVRRVLAAVRPGSIVILHDGGGDRSATLAALPAIVRGIRHRGLHLITLAPGLLPVPSAS